MTQVEERLHGVEFAQAFVAVANVAVFTPNLERVREFGLILGYEAASREAKGWDEAEALVADLNRLTEADVVALEILVKHQGQLVRDATTNSNYNDLAGAVPAILRDVNARKIPRDEFYSHASRLSGFGLAISLNWNQSTWGPQDHGFAATVRGMRLVEILGKP